MRIIVTGALGFIGSHLVERLLCMKHEVIGVDDLSGGFIDNAHKTTYEMIDCRDQERMDKCFRLHHPDLVYHLAANAAENKAQFSPIDITSRNYESFIKTLTPFIKYGGKRFVFTSSIAVYGALQVPFKEKDKPEPEDLYGITKLAAERSLKVMSEVHGFEYVIVRPHNVYGPKQNMADPYRNVVTIWMNALLRGEPYYIYGDGEQRRCFSYIDDVVDAIVRCGFDPVSGMTFNVGSDISYSLNDLSRAIQGLTEKTITPIYLPKRPQEVNIAIADHTQAKKYLGYKDKTSLAKGIYETWEWAKTMGAQEPRFTDLEIPSDKVPKNWL